MYVCVGGGGVQGAQQLKTWWHKVVIVKFMDDEELLDAANATAAGRVLGSFRPWFVIILFLVMGAWLVADVAVFDGLVPGTKDSFVIQSIPYEGDQKPDIIKWHRKPWADSNVSYTCMCSYTTTSAGALVWGAPKAVLAQNSRMDAAPSPGDLWKLCNTSGLRSLAHDDTADGNMTKDIVLKFLYQASNVELTPPITSSLLTYPAWQAARLSQARGEHLTNVLAGPGAK